jgi:hypothetical protein
MVLFVNMPDGTADVNRVRLTASGWEFCGSIAEISAIELQNFRNGNTRKGGDGTLTKGATVNTTQE